MNYYLFRLKIKLKSARSESLLGIFWEKGTQSPISTQASTDGQFYYLVLTELIV